MDAVLKFLEKADTTQLASDPRALAVAGIILVVAIIFRWKSVLLLLFAVGGTMAVMRYSRIAETQGGFDKSLVIFVVGSVLVGVVLIYFLFIKGD